MKQKIIQLLNSPFATIFASVATTFLIAAFFFKFAGPVPISVNQTTIDKESTFDVTGEGIAAAVPDIAQISLGIEVESPTVTQAQQQANKTINNISTALQSIGIKKENIKTTSYNVYPKREYKEGESTIDGYQVSVNLLVEVDDLEKINQAIDVATSLGANQIGQLNLTISDDEKEKLLQQARKEAVKNAKQQAHELTTAAGVKLGKIVNIHENLPLASRPVYEMARSDQEGDYGGGETQIQPGESEIKVSITLSYEIL